MSHHLVGFSKERHILSVARLLLADLLVPLLPGLDAKEFPFFTVQAATHRERHSEEGSPPPRIPGNLAEPRDMMTTDQNVSAATGAPQ